MIYFVQDTEYDMNMHAEAKRKPRGKSIGPVRRPRG
jgi:hypothetical protein